MAKEVSIKIDKDLLNLSKNERKAIIKGLDIAGDLTQNVIRRVAITTYTERTGALRKHILKDKVNKSELSVHVVSTIDEPPYGNFLNDGTKYIKARRFMEKGLSKAEGKFERIFVRELDKAM